MQRLHFMNNYIKLAACLVVMLCLSSCGAYFNQPFSQQAARKGEFTKSTKSLLDLPPAKDPVEIAVYNFSDQTGQYKPVENGSTFSTAITQGATTMLIKALGDSGWFIPIERENLSNLSTERNIIRNTKQEYIKGLNPNEPPLPPLLYAGLMLEGGIISYDTNIVTGGMGARYFGAGGSARYREDRISVYLRAVSTLNGEVLKTIYVSKTVLSQAVDVNLFRFVKFQRLLEAETGFTQNEPVHLAVKDAIDKAVHDLIIEGIEDGYWSTKAGKEMDTELVNAYSDERDIADNTLLFDRFRNNRRTNSAVHASIGSAIINGDYVNPKYEFSTKLGYKRFFNPYFDVNFNFNKFNLANKELVNEGYMSLDANLEYVVLPFDRLTPLIYAGGGSNISNYFKQVAPKVQAGLGLEYLLSDAIGFTIYGENNYVFADDLDNLIAGKRDDMYWRIGVGVNIYLGKSNSKFKDKQDAEKRKRKERNKIRRDNIKKTTIGSKSKTKAKELQPKSN